MTSEKAKTETTRRQTKASKSPTKPSKKDRLEAMLRRPKGATQKQLEKDLGWQPHSVRAAISVLRKGGTGVTLDRNGKTPTYRIDVRT